MARKVLSEENRTKPGVEGSKNTEEGSRKGQRFVITYK
jgi:hypothetical protein